MSDTAQACFTPAELQQMRLKGFGTKVHIDRTCRIYGAENVEIGSHVRIDAFTVLSAGAAGIVVGSHVHIGAGSVLVGSGGVTIEDFAGISARVCIFSSNEDLSGESLTGPTIPPQFRRIQSARIVLRRHATVGAGSVLLPGVELGTGCAIGALCVVKRSVQEFTINGGNPLRRVGRRSRTILDLERALMKHEQGE